MTVSLLPVVTAKEVVESGPRSAEGWIEGYLPKGAIIELTAKVKAGKTTYVLALCKAILTGGDFLGSKSEYASILYLTEEGPASLRSALNRAGLLDFEDLFFVHRIDVHTRDWKEVADSALQEMYNRGAKVLVVDTLARWAKLRGDDENSSGAAAVAIEPLEKIAKDDRTVLIARHDKKGESGEFGDWGRGSSGFSGAADVLLNLTRANQEGHPNRRKLKAISRFDDIPEDQTIELSDGEYLQIDSGQQSEIAKLTVMEALRESPKTFKELLAATNRSETRLRNDLETIDAWLDKTPGPGKGNPIIYSPKSGKLPYPPPVK